MKWFNISIDRQYDALLSLIREFSPDAVVHFAEQRAAPYSMRGSHGRRYTVANNIVSTNNLLAALVENDADIHLVHLGTMGIYGYGQIDRELPEGYLDIEIVDKDGSRQERSIMFPPHPGSVYHMTKAQDALMFEFYNRNDGLRITDLYQGVVWGTQTAETQLDEGLINRFDYDGEYGTVLNRFIVQAVVGHPLTVYGTGGQTRAFIHIQDTVRCIEMAIHNPPRRGDQVRIFNQMTETHQVRALAKIVSEMTGSEVQFLDNPRNEPPENRLSVENAGLKRLGLEPLTLKSELLKEIENVAFRCKSRCDTSKIVSTTRWRKHSSRERCQGV